MIFADHGIPPQIQEQFVLLQVVWRHLDGNLIKVAVRSPGKEESPAFKFLTQGQCACAGHQYIKDLTAFFRLAVSPFGSIIAETPPDGVVRSLFAVADKAVERRCITSFKKSNTAFHFSFAGMGLDKFEKFSCHIPFALGQQIVPRLSFLFEKHKQTVLFVDHIGAHHPGLEE